MNWELKDPVCGDIIRMSFGQFYHYGIYASDDEVIQFGLAPTARPNLAAKDVAVCVSTIEEFLNGSFLEVGVPNKKELKKKRKIEEILSFARSRIGETGYHILYNNCEHFAYECYLGEKYCSQTESVRSLFQSLPLLDIYVSEIPKEGKIKTVYPPARDAEINACGSEKVRREKYYAWKLLEYALERTFGKKLKKLSVTKNKNGKWECSDFAFSLSHSGNAVVVALSRKALGVDIERIEPVKSGVENKILTAKENDEFSALPIEEKNRYLLEKWTQKESVFKSLNQPVFHPDRIETANEQVETQEIEIAGEKYLLSVCSPDLAKQKLIFVPCEKL